MNASELLAQVRTELAARADPEFRRGVVNYFREPVDPWGVRRPDLKPIEQAAARQARSWPPHERERFAEALLAGGKLEEGALAIHFCRRFSKHYGAREFRTFERWLGCYAGNWAIADGLAGWLLAACIVNEPALIGRLPAWTRSRNRWKRRAAAVALLQEAKSGKSTSAVLDIAARLIHDPDEMVQKGVGWLLKETYPLKPREMTDFLAPLAPGVPRLVLRIAAEKMNRKDRFTLLARY